MHDNNTQVAEIDNTRVAGIDVGKAWLDVAFADSGSGLRVSNDEAGLERLCTHLAAAGVGTVGLEASGGYEAALVRRLRRAGMTVLVHQPIQVRLFARLRLQRAKTDRLDAALIAAFTASDPTDRRLAVESPCELVEQLGYIEQLEQDIARLKTRLEHQRQERLRAMVETDLAMLKRRRNAERRLLEAALRQSCELARRFELLVSIEGIGKPTALSLVLRLPELGRLSREQIAALAGLAPFARDSGKRQGQRHIAGGRTRVRTALYAAALPASFRWNPALMRLYNRLTANGKTHKQALVACARKLLTYANAVLQRDTPWLPAD